MNSISQQRLDRITARIERKHTRQEIGLVQSARRMVEDHDRNNGVDWRMIATSVPIYEAELRPIVKRMIAENIPHLWIPRKAANEYLASAEE